MIPRASITAWRHHAPWADDAQVEQDLVLTRALIEIFNVPALRENLAFRGGTALNKLFLDPPSRYSEDIDLVQLTAGPIGPVLDALRAVLDPWLGEPRREQGVMMTALVYRFHSEVPPVVPLRLKVEMNTREHGSLMGLVTRPLVALNPWYTGESTIPTYTLEELLGTKLRALFQRRKGRDLFDFWIAFIRAEVDDEAVVRCFQHYLRQQGQTVYRDEFVENLGKKVARADFLDDVTPLLTDAADYDAAAAAELVRTRLLVHLPERPPSVRQTKAQHRKPSGE
ncbi:MAG TPA: nucleotidyl transferase AbiEii/AbiGii toxin family protein [Longimicrobium sp.]|jgi:predicted nucleotidyltransferase component of viral defense system